MNKKKKLAAAYSTVATSFYNSVIRKDKRFNSTVPVMDVALLEPGTRAAVLAILADAKADGHDLRVMETFRSQARQAYVYMHGFSHLRKVGCHGYGLAADFGVFKNGVYDEEGGESYKFLVPLAKKHGLISGQDWGDPSHKHTLIDWGHVQRIPVFRQGSVFNNIWYPLEDYDPYADQKRNGIG